MSRAFTVFLWGATGLALAFLVVPVAATVLCSTVRRRGLVKVVFNGGNLAAAVAVLVATVHVVSVPGDGLSVRTIVGLGSALGKQTLAEGVEDEKQAELLAQLGVQVGQGWLFAKALPETQATEAIQSLPWRR